MDESDRSRLLLSDDLHDSVNRRGGAPQVIHRLVADIRPEQVSHDSLELRLWVTVGTEYEKQGRFYEAMAVYQALYDHILAFQTAAEKEQRAHKGDPLFGIAQCRHALSHRVLACRYYMLAACEDAITWEGRVLPNVTGAAFRLVWQYGLSDHRLRRYFSDIWDMYRKRSMLGLFPESILQDLDHEWISGVHDMQEASLYVVNGPYVRFLMEELGQGDGKALERLAHYLITMMPGCRAYRDVKSQSFQYDVVGVFEGPVHDFRSDAGRYFICECKDWNDPADVTVLGKLCRVLDAAKCKFGVLFSREGISGTGRTLNAEREVLKMYQDRGVVIAVVTLEDLEEVAKGMNFVTMLRSKYERIRLDLPVSAMP